MSTHEDLNRHEDVRPGSERGFGTVFAVVCAALAAHSWWTGSAGLWGWLGAAVVFAALAAMAPRALRPLNLVWFRFGMLLHRIISPVILAMMFYSVFTPIGLWMRLIGKRPLDLRFEPDRETYWIRRDPPGPPPESFPNQF